MLESFKSMRSLQSASLNFAGCNLEELTEGEIASYLANCTYQLVIDLSNCNLNKAAVFGLVKKTQIMNNGSQGALSIKLKE